MKETYDIMREYIQRNTNDTEAQGKLSLKKVTID